MPELPEMENYKRLLMEKVGGRTITHTEVNREKSINVSPDQFAGEVIGKRIVKVERRAKYILFQLDTGKWLLLHLMLGGWMYYGTEEDKPNRTFQVILRFGDHSLYFIGLRLGYLHLLTMEELTEKLADLGPEPLNPSFTADQFMEMWKKKGGKLKTMLVDQKFISGIGNCYSDEICFHARLLPMKKGKDLSPEEVLRLYHSIQSILLEAIRYGGYMEFPFFKGDAFTGYYDAKCKVYDRGDQPCYQCQQPIIKDELSSRKVFYCKNCQH